MTQLFFHGIEVLGFMGGVGLGAVGCLSIFIWLLIRPPRLPIVPAIIYLVAATTSCLAFLFLESLITGTAINDGYLLALPVAFCFPWSLLVVGLATLADVDLPNGAFFVAVAINTILIYGIGKIGRWRSDRDVKLFLPKA